MSRMAFSSRYGVRWIVLVLAVVGLGLLAGLAWAQEGTRTHVVQAGETLAGIAAQYGVTVEALVVANNLTDPDKIVAGQELIIPAAAGSGGETLEAEVQPDVQPTQTATPSTSGSSGRTYVVQPRDTIDTIGQRLNVAPAALIAANFGPGENPNLIFAGRVLVIPANAPPYPFPPGVTPPAPAEGIGGGGRGPDETYTVQPGDYLERIAQELDVAIESIIYANNLRRPYVIMAGDVLIIPGDAPPFGVVPPAPDQTNVSAGGSGGGAASQAEGIGGGGANVYVVQEGDTLLSIIFALGVDLGDFLRANPHLVNQIELEPGTALVIP